MWKEVAIALFFVLGVASASTSTNLFIKIGESDIKPYRVDHEVRDVHSGIECVMACVVSPNCVGGRLLFGQMLCQLTIHSSGVMGYRSDPSDAKKDFVFGVPCDASYGYKPTLQALISGHNDRSFGEPGISAAECKSRCTPLAWCLSADTNAVGCYLAGVDSRYVAITTISSNTYTQSSKKCLQ